MPIVGASQERRLRLLTGPTAAAHPAPAIGAFEAPMPSARPADRCERWPVDDPQALRALVVEATERGLSLPLAAVLLVERTLLAEELAFAGIGTLATRLDERAMRARVRVELSEALSAYLAALGGGQRRDQLAVLPAALVLPMRLSERVAARQILARLDTALLDSAIAWERAAVLEGLTMSEWAAFALLARR